MDKCSSLLLKIVTMLKISFVTQGKRNFHLIISQRELLRCPKRFYTLTLLCKEEKTNTPAYHLK